MTSASTDKVFAGSVPGIYQTHMVPLIFEAYAEDMVNRLRPLAPARILEVAAGTGVVTRRMADALPKAAITATDLNQAMLDQAASVGISRRVEWKQADAMQLPFADGAFDVVVCQFGAMFFPDRPKAYAEMRRALKPGGVFLFNVWDRIEDNEFAQTAEKAVQALFPHDPPSFMTRTPHGYFDRARIEGDVAKGGFPGPIRIDTVTAVSKAASAKIAAIAYCQGTPMRGEIESRDARKLEEATEAAAKAIAQRFGSGPIEGKIQAHVITAMA
jgi:SAM-dependent methyltransferase